MSKAKTAKEVLIAVQWIINRIGWSKGSLWRDQDYNPIECNQPIGCKRPNNVYSCCLLGALALVNADEKVLKHAKGILMDATNGSIVDWNDAPSRTKKDVRYLLHKVITYAS